MRHLMLSVACTPLFLIACGGDDASDACADYVVAYNDCGETYLAETDAEPEDVVFLDSEGECDPYSGDKDEATIESFNCLRDAYSAADCTSHEGVEAAEQPVYDCG